MTAAPNNHPTFVKFVKFVVRNIPMRMFFLTMNSSNFTNDGGTEQSSHIREIREIRG